MTEKLCELVQIPSVERAPLPGQPFGADVDKALQYTISLCQSLGMRTETFDGYAGHADVGSGDQTMGILVHLDVVPEGEGWTYPPFGGIVDDGRIYGRGSEDNKGAVIAAIYALRAVMESQMPLTRKVRIVFGCDEESGWECMNHYRKRVNMPDFGFSPDAEFPVCYAEKGILNIELTADCPSSSSPVAIERLSAGTRPNVVPGQASALIRCPQPNAVAAQIRQLAAAKRWTIETTLLDGGIEVTCEGVSAHASMPEMGKNAASMLILALYELSLFAPTQKSALAMLAERIGMHSDGTPMGVAFTDEPSGALTLNLGIVEMDETHLRTVLDIRYPVTAQGDQIVANISAACVPYAGQARAISHSEPLYLPKTHPVVSGLMRVYVRCTGDMNAKPYSMGGGTYARAMDNCVAFGIGFSDEPTSVHQANENIRIDALMRAAEIIAESIVELACI